MSFKDDVLAKLGFTEKKYVDFRTLMEVVAIVLEDGKVTHDDMPEIIAYVEELFEQYVRPFDIPGIGDFIEKKIDNALKASIPFIIEYLCEKFLHDDPEPEPIFMEKDCEDIRETDCDDDDDCDDESDVELVE